MLTSAQRAALKWFTDRGGDGVFDLNGVLLAAGESAPHTRATWNALRDRGRGRDVRQAPHAGEGLKGEPAVSARGSKKRRAAIADAIMVRHYRSAALRMQNFRCFYCLCPLSRHLATADHARPRSARGKTIFANIKASCLRCNEAKGALGLGLFCGQIRTPSPADLPVIHEIALDRHFWSLTWAACERIAAQVGIDPVPPVLVAWCGEEAIT
jgi:5-methylcytosine-specific restriction endonuclease McrA